MNSGRHDDKKVLLTPRDLKILRHVATFGLTTFDTLRHAFFDGKEIDAVKSTLRRLLGKAPGGRYLKAEKFDCQRVYYRLTRAGAKTLGLPLIRARAYGRQALCRRLAVLWFIHGKSDSHRRIVEFGQLEQEFGIKVHPIPRHTCYLDSTAETPRLGIILVDHGADATLLVRKASKVLGTFLKKGWFDDFIRDSAFSLTILTVSEAKKQAIDFLLPIAIRSVHSNSLNRLQASVGLGQHIEPNVVVVQGLANLLPGRE